jgi:hypothetical protein
MKSKLKNLWIKKLKFFKNFSLKIQLNHKFLKNIFLLSVPSTHKIKQLIDLIDVKKIKKVFSSPFHIDPMDHVCNKNNPFTNKFLTIKYILHLVPSNTKPIDTSVKITQ